MKIVNKFYTAAKHTIKRVPYLGFNLYCPICRHYSRKFAPAGLHKRKNARCVWCGSVERHRGIWLFFERKTQLFTSLPKSMLHFAPEPCIARRLQTVIGVGYITADLDEKRAIVKADITDLQFADGQFEVIYCCHVLEHVPDDRQAMKELHRVLSPAGWAIILVPISAEKTVEDPAIRITEDRLKHYGQKDHVRRYGRDFFTRLSDSDFHVEVIKPSDYASPKEIVKMQLRDTRDLFL